MSQATTSFTIFLLKQKQEQERTAEEIKSSLGAEPVDMKLYAKHKNSVSNKLIKPFLESISPSEFELRKPFKANLA